MWKGKFKIKHDDWICPRTLKYNVSAKAIPIKSYEIKSEKFRIIYIILYGNKNNISKFISSLHNDSSISNININKNNVYLTIKGQESISHLFNKSLFSIKPIFIENGFEFWELYSQNKNTLIKFYDDIKKFCSIKILNLKKCDPPNILQFESPKITQKQKDAFELAQKNGYYSYPRKINIRQLAKKAGIARTTFQEHLRKAESKILNNISENL